MTTPRREHAGRAGGSEGPYLVLVAFWQETAETDAIAHAVRRELFPTPDDYPRGAVVTFRREVATGHDFRRSMSRFDLAELFAGIDPR